MMTASKHYSCKKNYHSTWCFSKRPRSWNKLSLVKRVLSFLDYKGFHSHHR